jgi:hypothetical protein
VKECGVYRVLDKRDYRAHKQGEEFVALLDPKAEARAIMRGSIERLGTVVPRPQTFTFPDGWLEGGR